MNASLPAVRATLERRILVNYRVDPEVLDALLPDPFRPMLVRGHGIAGICLIRLADVRPPGVPRRLGVSAENAAHRMAVEWDGPNGPVPGVFIPRRDTSSALVALVGGRVFPGWHRRATFEIDERDDRFDVAMSSPDGARVHVQARVATSVMAGSVFVDLEEASAFFKCAPVGYSLTPRPDVMDAVELHTAGWAMKPLQVDHVESSFFAEDDRFPEGTSELDSAFLMEDLPTTWRARPGLRSTRVSGDALPVSRR